MSKRPMSMSRQQFLATLAAATFLGSAIPALAQQPIPELKIMAPAAPGGGWDQTARSMQQALDASRHRTQHPGDERPRRRRQRRHRAVRQRRQGRRLAADGQRLRHGRCARHEQIARDARSGHADRATDRGNAGDRRSRQLADQECQGSRRGNQDRHRQGDIRRRLRRRRRSHHGGHVRGRGRRRCIQGELCALLRRRRIARGHSRRQGDGRYFRLRRI